MLRHAICPRTLCFADLITSGPQIHDELVLECPACEEDLERLKVSGTVQAQFVNHALISVCFFSA